MNRAELAQSLFERIEQSVRVEPVTNPGWHGEPNKCHENVERWIAQHPTDQAIRGYLVTTANEVGALFDLHSVVQREDGSMVDVTPLPYSCSFIKLDLTDDQFEMCRKHLNQIPYSIGDGSDFWSIPMTDSRGQF